MNLPRPSRYSRQLAFTLIELLVVISIISLLVALLLPALKSARTAAQVTKGTTQVRQIQVALNMYSDTNDGYLPYSSMGNEYDQSPFWNELLLTAGFIQSREFFYSPGHNRNMTPATVNNLKFSGFGVYQDGPMPYLRSSTGTLVGYKPYNYNTVSRPNPSQMIVVGDSSWSLTASGLPSADGSFALNRFLFTYNKRFIRSYADGHAESSDSVNVYWYATTDRTGFWDLNGNGVNNGGSADEIRWHWRGPWYPRMLVPSGQATY